MRSFALTFLTVLLCAAETKSFVCSPQSPRVGSQLRLENRIAEMIDRELLRLKDRVQWRRQQESDLLKRQREAVPAGFDFNSPVDFTSASSGALNKIQARKDRRMARDDPARYCADRCVATGQCSVWEDLFDMSEQEVQLFCKECVLSDGEEPCDVPEAFIENAGKNSWEIRP